MPVSSPCSQCGRSNGSRVDLIPQRFMWQKAHGYLGQIGPPQNLQPWYNIAPGQNLAVVRCEPPRRPSATALAQRSDYATIQCPTGFQGLGRSHQTKFCSSVPALRVAQTLAGNDHVGFPGDCRGQNRIVLGIEGQAHTRRFVKDKSTCADVFDRGFCFIGAEKLFQTRPGKNSGYLAICAVAVIKLISPRSHI